jgi:hypothetical protein
MKKTYLQAQTMCRVVWAQLPRECDGFTNLHGLRVPVYTGTGAGWPIATLEKPAPVARV